VSASLVTGRRESKHRGLRAFVPLVAVAVIALPLGGCTRASTTTAGTRGHSRIARASSPAPATPAGTPRDQRPSTASARHAALVHAGRPDIRQGSERAEDRSGRAQSPAAKTVDFTANFIDPGDHFSPGGVDPTCQVGWVAIYGTVYFQDPLSATDTAAGCLSYDPITQLDALRSSDGPAFAFAGYTDEHIVGSLDGCGKGGFTAHQTDFKVTSFDPAAHTFHLTAKWVVAAGSGTGAFLGASGGGTTAADGTGSPDFTVTPPMAPFASPNVGTFAGTITCPHHR